MAAETWAQRRQALGTRDGARGDVAVTDQAGGTRVLKYNPRRVSFIIANQSANDAFAARAPGDVNTSSGIRLDARGGYLSGHLDEDGTSVQDEVYVQFATAAGNVYVHEIEEA